MTWLTIIALCGSYHDVLANCQLCEGMRPDEVMSPLDILIFSYKASN